MTLEELKAMTLNPFNNLSMKEKGQFITFLREKRGGLKAGRPLSDHTLIIRAVIKRRKKWLTADLLKIVQKDFPKIDKSKVYNTIDSLKKQNKLENDGYGRFTVIGGK